MGHSRAGPGSGTEEGERSGAWRCAGTSVYNVKGEGSGGSSRWKLGGGNFLSLPVSTLPAPRARALGARDAACILRTSAA